MCGDHTSVFASSDRHVCIGCVAYKWAACRVTACCMLPNPDALPHLQLDDKVGDSDGDPDAQLEQSSRLDEMGDPHEEETAEHL